MATPQAQPAPPQQPPTQPTPQAPNIDFSDSLVPKPQATPSQIDFSDSLVDTSSWPHVQLSSGQVLAVHPEDTHELLRRSPGAKIIEPGGTVIGNRAEELVAKGLSAAGLPTSIADIPNWFRHLTGTHPNSEPWWEPVKKAIQNPTQENIVAAVPFVGPASVSMAKDVRQGDYGGAAATLAGTLAIPRVVETGGAVAKAGGRAVSKVAETVGELPVKVKGAAQAITPESLTKRPETPAPQHGTPVRVTSPLDGPTVGRQLGGKDLSQESLDTLQKHVGDKIPVGSTAKNTLMKAVEPVSKQITETSSKMNDIAKDAPQFTTSVMQDNVFGEGTFTGEIEALKKNLPASVRDSLGKDIDSVVADADKALNSNDPAEVLEQRRLLGKRIDWDKIEKNPSTPAEVQNLARVKVYKVLGDKIHSEIPETVALDKILQPNLELRSHMASKLGQRVIDDPHAATAEAQSELKKGQTTIDNATHNEQVAKNWGIVKTALKAAGIVGIGDLLKHLDVF